MRSRQPLGACRRGPTCRAGCRAPSDSNCRSGPGRLLAHHGRHVAPTHRFGVWIAMVGGNATTAVRALRSMPAAYSLHSQLAELWHHRPRQQQRPVLDHVERPGEAVLKRAALPAPGRSSRRGADAGQGTNTCGAQGQRARTLTSPLGMPWTTRVGPIVRQLEQGCWGGVAAAGRAT